MSRKGRAGERDGSVPERVGFGAVLCGTALFFLFQYFVALVKLGQTSGGMENKFSALAREKYLDFLIWQNVQVLFAYAILAVLFAVDRKKSPARFAGNGRGGNLTYLAGAW